MTNANVAKRMVVKSVKRAKLGLTINLFLMVFAGVSAAYCLNIDNPWGAVLNLIICLCGSFGATHNIHVIALYAVAEHAKSAGEHAD